MQEGKEKTPFGNIMSKPSQSIAATPDTMMLAVQF
jgi:hypothetical protein